MEYLELIYDLIFVYMIGQRGCPARIDIFALNNITTALEFMREKEINLTQKPSAVRSSGIKAGRGLRTGGIMDYPIDSIAYRIIQ